jgi:hypothetical protein
MQDGDDEELDPVAQLREEWKARLSGLNVPGANRRLQGNMSAPRPQGRTLLVGDPDVPSTVPAGVVLAKSARRTAQWLRLDPALFEALTGLELQHEPTSQPSAELRPQTREWRNALEVVYLGFRLEQCLGTRDAATAWLRGHNTALGLTPQAAMDADRETRRVLAYVEQHLR